MGRETVWLYILIAQLTVVRRLLNLLGVSFPENEIELADKLDWYFSCCLNLYDRQQCPTTKTLGNPLRSLASTLVGMFRTPELLFCGMSVSALLAVGQKQRLVIFIAILACCRSSLSLPDSSRQTCHALRSYI